MASSLALAQGQSVLYVTDRCVMELRAEGVTVTEIAPGVDLQADVLAKADFELRVAEDLREMEARLFRAEPLRLALGPVGLDALDYKGWGSTSPGADPVGSTHRKGTADG